MAVIAGLVAAARPHQWTRNLLVFAAPVVTGTWSAQTVLGGLLAFGAFTSAAAGTYLINDVIDREADARHPMKRDRPVASGRVPPDVAASAGLGFLALALAVPATAGHWALAAVVGIYLAATGVYNAGVKHRAGAELGLVAAFYVLRAAGGAAATGTTLPAAILAVVALTAFYLAAGKRQAELGNLGADAGTRPVLGRYRAGHLGRVRRVAAGGATAIYALWAVTNFDTAGGPWLGLSIVPVALGFGRYERLIGSGDGERPDRLVSSDPPLVAFALVGFATLAAASYGG